MKINALVNSEVDISPNEECPMEEFEKELEQLINKHSIENVVDMPDFVLAQMICRMIEAMGPSLKRNLDWHGCNSTCHPTPNTEVTTPSTVAEVARGMATIIEAFEAAKAGYVVRSWSGHRAISENDYLIFENSRKPVCAWVENLDGWTIEEPESECVEAQVTEAGALAASLCEHLPERDQAMFIAGFQEAIKSLA